MPPGLERGEAVGGVAADATSAGADSVPTGGLGVGVGWRSVAGLGLATLLATAVAVSLRWSAAISSWPWMAAAIAAELSTIGGGALDGMEVSKLESPKLGVLSPNLSAAPPPPPDQGSTRGDAPERPRIIGDIKPAAEDAAGRSTGVGREPIAMETDVRTSGWTPMREMLRGSAGMAKPSEVSAAAGAGAKDGCGDTPIVGTRGGSIALGRSSRIRLVPAGVDGADTDSDDSDDSGWLVNARCMIGRATASPSWNTLRRRAGVTCTSVASADAIVCSSTSITTCGR